LTMWIIYLQWFFLIYMLGISVSYMLLNLISIFSIVRHMAARRLDVFLDSFSDFEPPVSILVPAYNEAATIESSVLSLLQLAYSEFEVIVINDGSRDETLQLLIDRFQLIPIPAAYQIRLPVKLVRGFYKSTLYPNLRVIDKENGGKADALNAGINATRYPLFCSVDADSILQRDSLKRVMQPFLEDPRTVAAGGTIRIVNGSEVRDGFLLQAGLPGNLLVRMQIIEYLRAFLFGRLGWSPLNAMLIISGAFGVFRKEMVVQAGGYNTNTVGEDMELVVRLHRTLRTQGKKYRISFVPDPICWTEAPSDLKTLKKQRTRWQVGLGESLYQNLSLLFNRRGGLVGWIAFPYMLIFELFGPVVEVAGYIFVVLGFAFGIVSIQVLAVFFLLAVGLGMLVSVTALLLEQISFHIYSSPRHMISLFFAALAENLGYRQLISLWRLHGLLKWIRGGPPRWGEMTRQATWQKKTELSQ
jgi:cellulose synthase/poly-beta-1,6-N-acetylglucosamine synthase-like glycosyltransferase